MSDKLNGQIVFLPLQEIKEYVHTEENLRYYDNQKIDGGIISNITGENFQRLNFDIISTNDHWGGYIKGFIYPDGKFLGHFHHVAEANLPNESIKGNWTRIRGGHQIQGVFNEGTNNGYGFYLTIVSTLQHNKRVVGISTARKVSTTVKRKSATKIESVKDVLNEETLRIVTTKSATIRKKKGRKGYNIYGHILGWNSTPSTTEDLMIGISIAYSWMPTMLDIYIKDKKELKKLLIAVQELGKIKLLHDINRQQAKIENLLLSLSSAINNSIVGTSKMLHIFFHKTIPIIDSNSLRGWSKIFKRYYKQYPELKLPYNIPSDPNRRVSTYIKYWKLMMMLKINTKSKSIRQVEEPFYWIGMK